MLVMYCLYVDFQTAFSSPLIHNDIKKDDFTTISILIMNSIFEEKTMKLLSFDCILQYYGLLH